MKKKEVGYLKWLMISLIFIALIIGMFIFNNTGKKVIQLPSSEINNYNGTKLDSPDDFRENSIKGVQYINISEYQLKIYGLVQNPKSYSYNQVLSHQAYEKVVAINCVEGWSATILWKGILIRELFDEVKPLSDASVIIFHAYDGYTVTYPVNYFANRSILLAYNMDNITIPPARGFPFVLVAEDKWGYKWIKWITEIEFSNDTGYKGYWESRGYTKEGNLNESFLS